MCSANWIDGMYYNSKFNANLIHIIFLSDGAKLD